MQMIFPMEEWVGRSLWVSLHVRLLDEQIRHG
jgi:hypothetical protein